MTRWRRSQDRRREPNISQLSKMLGFTDPKALPKILLDFWSPKFPHGQLADASDEQITQVADDFVQQKGSKLWSIRSRGPLYPDDADEEIKPKIFEILRRQRRNQLDIRLKRDRQQPIFSEKDDEEEEEEEDVSDKLMDDKSDTLIMITVDRPLNHGASGVNSTETVEEGREDWNDDEADTTPTGPASSLAPSASIYNHFHRSGLPFVRPAKHANIPSTIQDPPLRALSPPAVGPQKRGFEEISADVSPTAPTVTTQDATSRKRSVLKHSFLAGAAENEARSTYKRRSVDNDVDHSAGIEAYQGALALPTCPGQIGPSDQDFQTSKHCESVSYDIFQNNYSIDINKTPGLLRFLLRYCEDGMIQNRQKMHDGLTEEGRSSGRIGFFALREMLYAFQEEGLRVGAHLNY